MQVENRGTWVPLASATCEHGREIGYNMAVAVAVHFDDSSSCRQTGLGHGVDDELTSLDALGSAVQGMLGDAMARLETTLLSGN